MLAKEKDLTRQRDALNIERRNLPMVEIDKDYVFDGPNGTVRLIDMFEGRAQLIIYHFMFDPEWEDGCPSCTAGTDELSPGFFEHLHTRDTSYAMVSRAPLREARALEGEAGLGHPLVLVVRHRLQLRLRGHDRRVGRAPASTTSAPRPSSRPWARTSSSPTSRSRCRAAAASCRSTVACSTPTRSTPAASSRPAARTTSSTSPPSAARRSGRSRRVAASRRGRPHPTSRTHPTCLLRRVRRCI